MRLDELEKNILIAEKDFRSVEEKLRYVNLRMGYQKLEGKQLATTNPTKLITKSSYYYRLHLMQKKTKERAKTISRGRLNNLVNEHDSLLEDRIEVKELLRKAIADEKWMAAARLKQMQIQIGQRIASLSESIYYLTSDPRFHIERVEVEQELEEELNEQIRLFTQSTF